MSARRWNVLWASCGAIALAAPAGEGSILYVNGSCGSNAWSGTSSVCAAPNGPKLTIQAGIYAAVDGDEVVVADGVYTGPGNRGLSLQGKGVTLRSSGGPQVCIIDCQQADRAFHLTSGEPPEARIEGFTLTHGSAPNGGAAAMWSSSATFADCIFEGNTADAAGAIHHNGSGDLTLIGCTFADNGALGPGAVFSGGVNNDGSLRITGCVFVENWAQVIAAIGSTRPTLEIINNALIANIGDANSGAITSGSASTEIVNTILSRNQSVGILVASGGAAALLSSTLTGNTAGALIVYGNATLSMQNSILWNNGSSLPHAGGSGNCVNVDPLFVQPGTDDLRLSIGSPCANVGINALLPPDTHDLDGDGNVSEPLPIDLGGNPRVQDGTVDAGAYEGEYEPAPPAGSDQNLDEGEFAFLIPEGGIYNPVETAVALAMNVSGGDNAAIVVTQYAEQMHPGAGGYGQLGDVLESQTTMRDGQLFLRLYIPFEAGDLQGADPLQMSVTRYDPDVGSWALAVAANTANSPGFASPIGDRIVVEGGSDWGLTWESGDHGVYWDPASGQGFTWANVDYASQCAAGAAYCPSDCRQTPDGNVGVLDLLLVLADFGLASGGPSDVNFDGLVDLDDVVQVIDDWGPCGAPAYGVSPGPASPQPQPVAARSGRRVTVPAAEADVNRDGLADGGDVLALKAAWGPCAPGSAGVLDRNGTVDAADLLRLLAAWPVTSPATAEISRSARSRSCGSGG